MERSGIEGGEHSGIEKRECNGIHRGMGSAEGGALGMAAGFRSPDSTSFHPGYEMVLYRRNLVPGGTYFFTVTLADRGSDLLVRHIGLLREAFRAGQRA